MDQKIYMAKVNLPDTGDWENTIWDKELKEANSKLATHISTPDESFYKIDSINSVTSIPKTHSDYQKRENNDKDN